MTSAINAVPVGTMVTSGSASCSTDPTERFATSSTIPSSGAVSTTRSFIRTALARLSPTAVASARALASSFEFLAPPAVDEGLAVCLRRIQEVLRLIEAIAGVLVVALGAHAHDLRIHVVELRPVLLLVQLGAHGLDLPGDLQLLGQRIAAFLGGGHGGLEAQHVLVEGMQARRVLRLALAIEGQFEQLIRRRGFQLQGVPFDSASSRATRACRASCWAVSTALSACVNVGSEFGQHVALVDDIARLHAHFPDDGDLQRLHHDGRRVRDQPAGRRHDHVHFHQ